MVKLRFTSQILRYLLLHHHHPHCHTGVSQPGWNLPRGNLWPGVTRLWTKRNARVRVCLREVKRFLKRVRRRLK